MNTSIVLRTTLLFVWLCLLLAFGANADTITGTVKDPSGAVAVGAHIEISGGNLAQPIVLNSDESGKFSAPNLAPGKYSVRVAKEGFDEIATSVELQGAANLELKLTIAAQQTSVTVSDKSAAFANSDSVYRQLRDLGLGNSYHCENFTLPMDVGTFELKSGTITFLNLVNRFETGAIFIGQGHFTLKPVARSDKQEMLRRSGKETVEEDFTEAVFRFTPGIYLNLPESWASGPRLHPKRAPRSSVGKTR